MIAVGVAKPRAHGQAMINTAMKVVRAKMKLILPTKYQANSESVAMIMTVGTK